MKETIHNIPKPIILDRSGQPIEYTSMALHFKRLSHRLVIDGVEQLDFTSIIKGNETGDGTVIVQLEDPGHGKPILTVELTLEQAASMGINPVGLEEASIPWRITDVRPFKDWVKLYAPWADDNTAIYQEVDGYTATNEPYDGYGGYLGTLAECSHL